MRTGFVALLLLLPPTGVPAPAPAPAFRTTGAFFALSVADLEASAAWYARTLGLATTMPMPAHDGIRVAVLSGGGLTVELLQHNDARSLGSPSSFLRHGIFKVGVTVANYDEALATLRSRGAEIALGPFPGTGEQPANVIIRDNAGNLIQLFATR